MKYELQRIISGESQVKYGAIIQTIAHYLSQSAGGLVKEFKHFKKQETEVSEQFVTKNNLWVLDINLENYVSEGAEQKVYLKDGKNVIKLNDAIYYNSWIDYENVLTENGILQFIDTVFYIKPAFYGK